jgi:hypothetical protein
MDISKPKGLKVIEAVLSTRKFTQYQIWKQVGVSFGHVNKVVKHLIEKNAVTKVGSHYQLTSYGSVLQLFAAHRTFPKPAAVFQVAGETQQILSYLAENNCIFCLTTAWQHYDDYLHDSAIHAYLPTNKQMQDKIMDELSGQPKSINTIYLYPRDIPVEPFKVKNIVLGKGEKKSSDPFQERESQLKQLPVTSETRTLLDMYSSHYAYGVQQWITKKVGQWQRG